MSYPLYLYHWMGMFAAHFVARRLWLPSVGLVAYVIALVAGAAAYVFVDRRVIRLRGHLYRRRVGWAFMATAYSLLVAGLALAFTR